MSDVHESETMASGADDEAASGAGARGGGRTGLRQRLWSLRVLIAVGLAAFVIGGLGGVALAKGGASNDGGGFGGHGGPARTGGPGAFQRGGMPGRPGVQPDGPRSRLGNGSSGRTP